MRAAVAICAILAGIAFGANASAPPAEAQLKEVLDQIRLGRLDAALGGVDGLIERHPNFRLAHLVRGDLLLARSRPIEGFGNTGHASPERVAELRSEALARLRAYERLAGRVQRGGTPVVIAQRVEWVTPAAWQAERDAFLQQLEAWRTDWESRDTARYLAHYARGFRSEGMDLAAWGAHKRRVNVGKAWIELSLADVSVLRSPGEGDTVLVTFEQDYRSSNLSQRSRKRQFWIMEKGRWKIACEGLPGRAPDALPESFPGGKRAARQRARRK